MPRLFHFGGLFLEISQKTEIPIEALPDISSGKPAPRVSGDGHEGVMEYLSTHLAMFEQLVEYPQDAVVFDILDRGEAPKSAVAGKKNPSVELRQADGEGVGQRKCGDARLIGERQAHPAFVERLDAKAEPLERRAVVIPKFPFIEQIGYRKLPRQTSYARKLVTG